MKVDINIISLFPEIIWSALNYSLLGRAAKNGLVKYRVINPRDFTKNKHKQVDDYPYGGGPGMLIMAPPVVEAVESIDNFNDDDSKLIITSAQGKRFSHEIAVELGKSKQLTFICGHYEGIDERVLNILNPEEISLGDFVTMGGEFPALVMIEAIVRLLPGIIGNIDSAEQDSFVNGLLDFPQYTRPRKYRGFEVPEILLSGNHKKIEEWRHKNALFSTKEKRPDLIK